MNQYMVLYALLPLIIVYLLWWTLSLVSDPLKDLPGPALARFTRLWLLKNYGSGSFEQTNLNLHRKFGKIVRIAPNEYSIDDPTAIKVIYGPGSDFIKADWYSTWGDPAYRNLFSSQDPIYHANLKRNLNSAYSTSSLATCEGFINSCVLSFLQKLEKTASSRGSIDLGWCHQCYLFDVVGLMTFSHSFDMLDHGEDKAQLAEFIHSADVYSSMAGVFPNLHFLVYKLMGLNHKPSRGTITIQQYVENRLAECRTQTLSAEGPIDFVHKMVDAQQNVLSGITEMDICVHAQINIMAGTSTTQIALTTMFYYLCKYPETLMKLRTELAECESSGRLSDPVTFQEAQGMPYLQAVIKEATRLHSPVGWPMPRVVPRGGRVIAGRVFPVGTVVSMNPWVAHANETVFEDAGKFCPERWMGAKESVARQDSSYLSFGRGARTCIGKNMSLMIMSKLIPQIVRSFDLTLTSPDMLLVNKTMWFAKPARLDYRVKKRTGT